MTVQAYFRVFMRWWWLFLLGLGLGLGGGYGAQVFLGTVAPGSLESYSATATVSVGTETQGFVQGQETLDMANLVVPTYVELAKRPPITDRVVEKLGLPIASGKLASSHLEVIQPEKTQLIEITGKYPDPVTAAAIANETAVLLQEASPLRPMRLVQIVSLASVPESPDFTPYLLIGVTGVLGVLLALGLVLLIEFALDRPYTSEWAAARLQLPILGTFDGKRAPGRPTRLGQRRPGLKAPNEPVWWTVMATLDRAAEFSANGTGPKRPAGKSIVVTGGQTAESRTAAAVALATASAASGRRTILVDADVRQPYLARWLNLAPQSGLTTLAKNGYSREDARKLLVPGAIEGFSVLPAGPKSAEAGRLIHERFWKSLLSDLCAESDLVVVNGPAIQAAPQVMTLVTSADGIVEVVDLGQTRAPSVNETRDILGRAGATILGVVLNRN